MDQYLFRAALNQTCESFTDVGVFNLEKRGLDESKVSTLRYCLRSAANVVVRFAATTAVTNNQYPGFPIASHAADTASAINNGSQ
jgi:hypothetical protein